MSFTAVSRCGLQHFLKAVHERNLALKWCWPQSLMPYNTSRVAYGARARMSRSPPGQVFQYTPSSGIDLHRSVLCSGESCKCCNSALTEMASCFI